MNAFERRTKVKAEGAHGVVFEDGSFLSLGDNPRHYSRAEMKQMIDMFKDTPQEMSKGMRFWKAVMDGDTFEQRRLSWQDV